MSDTLVKAITKGVRIYAAVTTDLVNEAIRRHDCSPTAAAALGRTMTGALLMAANLKNKEALTVSFQGNGPLGYITADATPEGYVRGYVGNPHVDLPLKENGKLDVGGAVGQGMVQVTRFTGLGDPMRGSSEIVSGEIAEDLTNYLFVSEQTASSVGLGVLVGTDRRAMAS
ncbi:MAG TPA: redox-regulated molecular chaperone Hsp33, partial [Anaerovibrio sp.]|nr:redox-regulated molecular chaperone Hsp33 [Anaerovibrio sp.]